MTKFKFSKIVPVALIGVVLGGSAIAFAAEGAEGARKNCSGGEHKDPAARFQKADKNSDGFITKDEAGDKRWEHIKVADANGDGKISMDEMKKAHEEGKLGRHGKKA